MLAAILLFNAFLGLLLATVLLRADVRRRENQMLALACVVDACVTGGMGILVALGHEVAGAAVVHFCNVGRLLIVHPTLEFTYAFPFDERPPRAVRWAGLTATAAAVTLSLWPVTSAWFDHWSNRVFYIPYFVVTAYVLLRTVRRMRRSGDAKGALAVLAALGFRWGAEMVTYLVIRSLLPRAFPAAFTFDATAAVFIGYVVITSAVLQYRFFRVRGLVAEAVLYSVLALSALAVVALGIDLVLVHAHTRAAVRLWLVGIALLPLGAWLVARRAAPHLEAAILLPLDPRRTMRKATLERVLRDTAALVDPEALCKLTREAVASLSGGRAAFLRAREADARSNGDDAPLDAELPPAVAEHLASSPALVVHRFEREALPEAQQAAYAALNADLLVPARFEGKLFGALAVDGGEIDQDTISTAIALADNLASKLAHHALYHRAFDLQRQLEEAHRLATLGSFAAAIAHDIRTPLTSVRLNVQMIRSKSTLSADDVECADIALEELTRMGRYVSEILDYAKPIHLQPIEVDVTQLIEETARGMGPLLESRKLLLDLSFPPSGLPMVRADAARLRQVLENLLENAADASPSGGGIRLQARPMTGDKVAIDVIDSGRGIAPKDIERIFEPFFTTRSEGTGLGLAIVKKLIRAHEGEITVRSAPGHGATFTVVLPS